jgi:hypothetical protein
MLAGFYFVRSCKLILSISAAFADSGFHVGFYGLVEAPSNKISCDSSQMILGFFEKNLSDHST